MLAKVKHALLVCECECHVSQTNGRVTLYLIDQRNLPATEERAASENLISALHRVHLAMYILLNDFAPDNSLVSLVPFVPLQWFLE